MAYQLKEGNGSLFPSKQKKSERSPDMYGSLLLNGVMYKLSGWTKHTENGKFLSLSAKVDDKQPQQPEHSNHEQDNFDPPF